MSQTRKRRYLLHFRSDTGFMGIGVNLTCPFFSFTGGSLGITPTVSLIITLGCRQLIRTLTYFTALFYMKCIDIGAILFLRSKTKLVFRIELGAGDSCEARFYCSSENLILKYLNFIKFWIYMYTFFQSRYTGWPTKYQTFIQLRGMYLQYIFDHL